MILELLPFQTAGAAENMACDFLLLRRYPRPGSARFRHYEWRRPAFTFGYSQKVALVRAQLPPGEAIDLCRRPTGGGIVDHREDWTYALVIPRGHRLEELRAVHSYRLVHEALREALQAQGVDADLEECETESQATAACRAPGERGTAVTTGERVCFQRAEVYDVVHRHTRLKIAGAAQKRTKDGLLFQGSIWRPAAVPGGAKIDWDRFEQEFVDRLARGLGVEAQPVSWPDFDEHEREGLIEHYASPEWIEQR